MGLLDQLGDQGMLGLMLMDAASAKPVRTSFGGGLLQGMMGLQQMKQQQAEQQAREEERKQRAAMQAMQAQQMQMQLDDRLQAKQQQQQRASYLDAIDPSAGPAMPVSLPRALNSGISLQEFGALAPQAKGPADMLAKIDPKDYTPESFSAFMKTGNAASLMPAPKDSAPTELSKLIAEMNKLPPDSPLRRIYQQQISKIATHPPGVSVSYGAPMAGIGPDGNPVFFSPPKDPTKGGPVILPGVKPPAGSEARPTEDQAKAAGWLSQAENAYRNMISSGFTKDGSGSLQPKPEAYPGAADLLEKVPLVGGAANAFRSADRQKFIQASSSMSEALLRAATGAGVNMDEARQKVQELTPVWGERPETTKQKMASIPIYISSLRTRAGKAAAASQPASGADASDPLGLRGGR